MGQNVELFGQLSKIVIVHFEDNYVEWFGQLSKVVIAYLVEKILDGLISYLVLSSFICGTECWSVLSECRIFIEGDILICCCPNIGWFGQLSTLIIVHLLVRMSHCVIIFLELSLHIDNTIFGIVLSAIQSCSRSFVGKYVSYPKLSLRISLHHTWIGPRLFSIHLWGQKCWMILSAI